MRSSPAFSKLWFVSASCILLNQLTSPMFFLPLVSERKAQSQTGGLLLVSSRDFPVASPCKPLTLVSISLAFL